MGNPAEERENLDFVKRMIFLLSLTAADGDTGKDTVALVLVHHQACQVSSVKMIFGIFLLFGILFGIWYFSSDY